MDLSQVGAVCEAAMREYGMPARIKVSLQAAGEPLYKTVRLIKELKYCCLEETHGSIKNLE